MISDVYWNTGFLFCVYNGTEVSDVREVTGGVPITEGDVPEGSQFVLHDVSGCPVPLKTEVLAW